MAHDGVQLEESDLALNDGTAVPSKPEGAGPVGAAAPVAAVFQHAIAWLEGEPEQRAEAPAEPLGLGDLVQAYAGKALADAEESCLAKAVYFEARGEPIEGQLAVAQVVLNRAASGRYPATLCGVITQKAQFSFIHAGRFPKPNRKSAAWKKAVAIAHIAKAGLASGLDRDVLWYHATYVSPQWGKRLTRETQIGLHIFYS